MISELQSRACGSVIQGSTELGTPRGVIGRSRSFDAPRACNWMVALVLGMALLAAEGQTVLTLGGGPVTLGGPSAGFRDGDTLQNSQFNFPSGLALDGLGHLFVADRGNGAVRRLDLSANRTVTVITNLPAPVDVLFDDAGTLDVLNQDNGTILQYDRFDDLYAFPSTLTAGLDQPTAFALDAQQNLWVTELGGTIRRVGPDGQTVVVASGLLQPHGIAVLDNGFLAVSDTGHNVIRILDPSSGVTQRTIGTGLAGYRNGPPEIAQFNQPWQLARAPNGNLVVADRSNQRVRLIAADGTVTTLYGLDPSHWVVCSDCYPGWFDGDPSVAESREPVGVTVDAGGLVYVSEDYYHLIRVVTSTGLEPGGSGGGSGNGTTNLVRSPVIQPDSGYFPMGQVITVRNPNSVALVGTTVYYTTDGTEPTTNSQVVPMLDGTGTILWREHLRDLTSLRVKAFAGTNSSDTVAGVPAAANEIGVPRDLTAGMGSTAVLPVVVNLRTNEPLRSLQFRVEVTPNAPSVPAIPAELQALTISTNDFVPLVTSDQGGDGTATFYSTSYTAGTTRGLAVSFLWSRANFSVSAFGVVALVAVPIPPTAQAGDSYSVRIVQPSGTADAAESVVDLNPMTARQIRVASVRYRVGDSAPGTWYDAESTGAAGAGIPGFGNGTLDNADVNNVFAASLGIHVPFPSSDLFNAMDAYPEDAPGAVGGDGMIRFLDWQVVLRRSLGLDPAVWYRSWTPAGRVAQAALSSGAESVSGDLPAVSATALPGAVWTPAVRLEAGQLERLASGTTVHVPVFVEVRSGASLTGMQFLAQVVPAGGAPVLSQPARFEPAEGIPGPIVLSGLGNQQVATGWSLLSNPFQPALVGRRRVGDLVFSIPKNAHAGQSYRVRFQGADGASDLSAQYDFETLPGRVWVEGPALQPAQIIPDEWKRHFFGRVDDARAADSADPDGDGVSNLEEYEAGTDPTDPHSRLQLRVERPAGAESPGPFRLSWLSAPGKQYVVEESTGSGPWKAAGAPVTGNGQWLEESPAPTLGSTHWFRLRLLP